MSLMDGGLAGVFASVFAPLYLPATLYRRADVDDGSGTVTVTWTGEAVRAQLDSATQAMRMTPGYTDEDMAIYILASGISPVTTDCEITIKGQRWAIASITQDPAGAYFLCRGQRA